MSLRETAEFQRGEEFERALSAYLQKKGWGVLPVYNYSGQEDKAPRMESYKYVHGFVLPDLFVARQGVSLWCEAKRKTRADFTRITQRLETGLNLRLYRQYKSVKAESGIPVWLFFGHEREDSVRFIEIDDREPRIYEGDKMGFGGMAFFPWDALAILCRLSEMVRVGAAA